MELLHVSRFLPLLLAVCHYLSSLIELLAVSYCLPWVSQFYSQCHRVAMCLSFFVAGSLSLSLPVLLSCWLSLTECLSLSPIVANSISVSQTSHVVSASISQTPMVSAFLSLSTMDLLHVCYYLPQLLAVSRNLSQSHGVAACLSLSPTVACCPLMSIGYHGVVAGLSMYLVVGGCL